MAKKETPTWFPPYCGRDGSSAIRDCAFSEMQSEDNKG
jgi:hypothetical protein